MAEEHPLCVFCARVDARTTSTPGSTIRLTLGPVAVPLLRPGDGARDRPGALAAPGPSRSVRARPTTAPRSGSPDAMSTGSQHSTVVPSPGALITRTHPPGELRALHHRRRCRGGRAPGREPQSGIEPRPSSIDADAHAVAGRPRRRPAATWPPRACRALTIASCAIRYRSAAMSGVGLLDRSSSSTSHRPAGRRGGVLQIQLERRRRGPRGPAPSAAARTAASAAVRSPRRPRARSRASSSRVTPTRGTLRASAGACRRRSSPGSGRRGCRRRSAGVPPPARAGPAARARGAAGASGAGRRGSTAACSSASLRSVMSSITPRQNSERAVLGAHRARPRRGSTASARPSCSIRYSCEERARRVRSRAGAPRSPRRGRRGAAALRHRSGSPTHSSTVKPRSSSTCGLVYRFVDGSSGRSMYRIAGTPSTSVRYASGWSSSSQPSRALTAARDQPGQQRGARHDAREVEPLRRRVVVAADRAEAVERRRPGRARRVRVRRAAGRGVAQLEPELRGEPDREDPPGARPRIVFSIGRCQPSRADLDRESGSTPVARTGRSTSRLGRLERPRGRASAGRPGAAPLGHHVRPRAALDDADVHRHAGPASVERLERDRSGAPPAAIALPPVLGLHARVRGAAVHVDVVVGDRPCAPTRCRRSRARPPARTPTSCSGASSADHRARRTASRSPRRGCRRT